MTTTQHEELETRIESRLKSLDIVIKLGWSLIAGAFVIGVWVATIQIAVNNHAVALQEAAAARQADHLAIRALEVKDSGDTQILKAIVEKLERIERKLENP